MTKQEEKPTYIGFLHGDFFLVNAFDARPYVDAKGIYGSPALYGTHKDWHIHPQLLFMKLDHWDPQVVANINFSPMLGHMDTGGMMIQSLKLGSPEHWYIPKRYNFFYDGNALIPKSDEASEALKTADVEDNGKIRKSCDQAQNGARCDGYEVFDDAWVHSRHAKFTNVTYPGVSLASYDEQSLEWLSPKNAYIKGLVEGRIQLCSAESVKVEPHGMTLPSGSEMEPGDDSKTAIEKARNKLLKVLELNPVQMLEPDNAYMKGWLDASLLSWNKTPTRPQHDYINTHPEEDAC